MALDDKQLSPFETIRRNAEDGSEYWSARDLAKILGYTQWRNFVSAIKESQGSLSKQWTGRRRSFC